MALKTEDGGGYEWPGAVGSNRAIVGYSAILLEHDRNNDALYAVGTLGGEMFNAFFEKFEFKLALDYGASRIRHQVASRSVVVELEHFCRQQIRC